VFLRSQNAAEGSDATPSGIALPDSIARGQRLQDAGGVRFVQTAVVRADWRDLHAWRHALLLVPEPAPIPSEPERVLLRCWRAHPIAGGYAPSEEPGLTRLSREPDGSWRTIGPL